MKKIKNKKILIAIFVIILIILMFIYGNIIQKHLINIKFANQSVEISEKNEQQIFKIEKIIICSSANAIDISEEKNLQNLNIYQYTDIAIYLDNGEELSNVNTISRLYIDNISLEGNENIGTKSLKYKNPLNFGLKQEITEEPTEGTNLIEFNIVYTNEENEQANYEEPTFYTDCSNPITLEYVNYNLVSGYKMNENQEVTFDGNILEAAGIKAEDIECKVKFKINLVSNENEKYSCWINFEIPLDDIFEGTTMKSKTTNGSKYVFFRE